MVVLSGPRSSEAAGAPVAGGGTTIYSVAERAGVSIATVSRVLAGGATVASRTRERVLTAARELDYRPQGAARSLAVRRAEAHGMVMDELTGPYHTGLLVGYESMAAERGQSVILRILETADGAGDPVDRWERSVRQLAGRVDGLVIASPRVPDDIIAAVARTVPVVLVGRPAVPGCDVLRTENRSAAEELVTHLLRCGRRRPVFVGDPDGALDVSERYDGYRRACRTAGTEPGEPLRVPQTEAAGQELVRQPPAALLAADALVCANDELALALQWGRQRQGVKVPADVAIVGWDDVLAARYITPGLTTVRQPVRDLGRTAADLLHQRVAGAAAADGPVVLPSVLVHRGSCCADLPGSSA